MRTPLSSAAAELAAVLREHGVTSDTIADSLGPSAHAALFRGEPAAVRRTTGDDAVGFFVRTLFLHDAAPAAAWDAWLPSTLIDALTAAGVLVPYGAGGELRCVLDIRPHVFQGTDYWVFSDADASMPGHIPGSDHVLGVGAASLSLAQSVPTSPVSSLLDVGTGCGVQLLAQAESAARMVGTDVHARAVDFADATCHANGLTEVELLQGSWFEPVAGRRFERIVSNPPFVVGPPQVGHVYRDSGLALDGASELVVSQAIDHLTVGGTAHLAAAWVHSDDCSWQQRVASWFPDQGVCAWVLQRDVADPALYVGTWLRDESLDPADAAAAEKTKAWLDFFDEHQVTGVGFGFVAIQRLDPQVPSEIVCEELRHDYVQPLGPEIEEYFSRMAWLRGTSVEELAECSFQLRPGVAVEKVSVARDDGGITPVRYVISRTDGPRWSHEIDEHLAAILAGLNPEGLTLAETSLLYFLAHGVDADAVNSGVAAAVAELIRHGIVVPV